MLPILESILAKVKSSDDKHTIATKASAPSRLPLEVTAHASPHL
jgi:hypothetical protein